MRRFVKYLLAACIAASLLLAAAPASAAPNCYGDWCSGQDPQTTGCAGGAKTVASVPLELGRVIAGSEQYYWKKVGILELRWSPSCKTNWARVQMTDVTSLNHIGVTQDTGYGQDKWPQGFFTESYPGTYYTPMIYSPNDGCYAYVEGDAFKVSATDWV